MNNKTQVRQGCPFCGKLQNRGQGLTLLELVIAIAILVIVSAALLPQFRVIRNSWDSKAAGAEVLQNGRVLIDHINHNLTEATQVTAVSDSTTTLGYIEFEDNDGNTLRYDVDANNYVEFGVVGSLSELAGPVSQLQFTCYEANDFITPITDVNDIRYVVVESTLTNAAAMGRDIAFTAQVYVRTNTSPCIEGLLGWWKLNETSGLTAADSSGNNNDGTLTNMVGDEWTTGQKDGALEFDGNNDYVSIGNAGSGIKTIAFWMQADSLGTGDATDTGLKSPSATGDDYNQWSNPTNAYASNNNYASEGSLNEKQDYYDFSLGVPAGATINGIEVVLEARVSSTKMGSGSIDVELSWNGGSSYTSTGYTTGDLTTSDADYTLGGSSNNWGRAWDDGEFSSANFRVRVNADPGTKTLYIDHIETKVYYTPIGTPTKVIDIDGSDYIEIDDANITATGFPGTTTIYVDGEVGSAVTTSWHHVAITDTTGVNASALDLGRVLTGYFGGILDDVRLYDNVLSAEEISDLADAGQVTYQEFTEAKAGSNVTSITILTPTGTSEGDLLVAAVATDSSETISAPGGEGWTLINHGSYSSYVTLGAWWKLADASDVPSGDTGDTGFKSPSATGDDYNQWSNPTNAYASNNNYASESSLNQKQDYYDFSLGVPADIAIRGIEVVLEARVSSTQMGSGSIDVELSWDGGSSYTSSGYTTGDLTTSDVDYTLGGSSNEWGRTWDDGEFSNTNFRVRVNADPGTKTLYIDHIQVKVYYGEDPPSHQFTWGSSEQCYGWMMRFTGHDSTTPINVSGAQGGSSSSPDCPSVTTTVANCMIVRIGGFDDDDITVDNPGLSGHTAITMDESAASDYSCSGGAGYVQQAAIGDSGISEFSLTGSEEYRTITIAIAPNTESDEDCGDTIGP